MALTKEQTAAYIENLKEFKAYIEDLKKEVSLYKAQMKKNTNKAMDPYYQMALVLNSIKLINTFVGMNEVSLITRNLKAEEQLNYARKEIYAVLSAMEKVVGNDHENGLDENRELMGREANGDGAGLKFISN